MFVFSQWDTICQRISAKYRCIRADEILKQDSYNWIVVKHDVETDVIKALELAKIEKKYGIRATYYVQADLLKDNYTYLQQISEMGHEVTYHYDVLDAFNGDIDKAIDSFQAILDDFSAYDFQIKTVCPHGNPIKIREGWTSNKDFFRNKKVNERFPDILDIVVHLPDRLGYPYTYVSDAGYGWKIITSVHTNDLQNQESDVKVRDKDLLETIENIQTMILSTHPHRWERNKMIFFVKYIRFQMIRYMARKIASVGLFKKLMSRYYFLAKKI